MAQYSLQGRTLFITGGANGIGAETARQAVARGARVALADIDIAAAESVAASLPSGSAIAIECDVRDYDSIEAAVDKTVDAFGGIDIAMANAGIEMSHTARGVPLIELERLADINFTGVMRTARATLPHLIERRGYLLVTASLAAILHAPPLSHYVGSKAGVEAFANAVRLEVKHKGVDVGVAYFGFIDTPMVRRGRSDPLLAEFEARQGDNFISKTYSVSTAAKAVVAGLESHARRVMVPRWIRIVMVLRAAMPRLIDRVVGNADLAEFMDRLDERDLAQGDSPDPSREHHERLLS